MQILYFHNLYSGYTLLERPIDAIHQCMANPINNIFNRDDVPLWAFYDPISKPSLAKDGLPAGCADNMLQVHALQIDYDGELPIKDFCEMFNNTYFLLYTSFRSSPAKEKFRVILPLAEPIKNGLLRCAANKELVSAMFPACDQSTINSFRKQRVPALDPRNPHHYQYIIHDGHPLNLPERKMIANYIDERDRLDSRSFNDDDLPEQYYNIQGIYIPRKNSNFREKLIAEITQELNSLPYHARGNGVVHASLLRCWGRLIGCGIPHDQAVGVMRSSTPTSIKAEIEAIFRIK